MRFFGLFGNSVPSGELKTFGGEGGKDILFYFFLSKIQCCTSKNPPTEHRRPQFSSLSFLSFSFLSLSSLCGKGRLGGWPVLAGEKGGAHLSWFRTPVLPAEMFSSEHLPWVCYPSLKSSKMSLPGGTPVS